MIVLQWCKTQVMCLLILAYVGIIFIRDGNQLKKVSPQAKCNTVFDLFFAVSELAILFDGITACTINFLDQVPKTVNLWMHLGMFLSYEIYAMLLFLYWVSATVGIPKVKWKKMACILPGMISVCLTIWFLPGLEFRQGNYTNYSMGTSVYVCLVSIVIYSVLTLAVIISKYRYIPEKKKESLIMTLFCVIVVLSIQIIFPEALISCIAASMVTISIYINMENPAIQGLQQYHHEMVMGFATLVDNKDDSTGGHIRRSSAYAVLIAENLRKNPRYKYIVTKDFLDNLVESAPMHDIGKIGIPDSILQKPGKLTPEECYSIIKNGRGSDFDPDIVDAFLADRDKVEAIYFQRTKGVGNS